jgi:hypothetical protein
LLVVFPFPEASLLRVLVLAASALAALVLAVSILAALTRGAGLLVSDRSRSCLP